MILSFLLSLRVAVSCGYRKQSREKLKKNQILYDNWIPYNAIILYDNWIPYNAIIVYGNLIPYNAIIVYGDLIPYNVIIVYGNLIPYKFHIMVHIMEEVWQLHSIQIP